MASSRSRVNGSSRGSRRTRTTTASRGATGSSCAPSASPPTSTARRSAPISPMGSSPSKCPSVRSPSRSRSKCRSARRSSKARRSEVVSEVRALPARWSPPAGCGIDSAASGRCGGGRDLFLLEEVSRDVAFGGGGDDEDDQLPCRLRLLGFPQRREGGTPGRDPAEDPLFLREPAGRLERLVVRDEDRAVQKGGLQVLRDE